MKKQKLFENVYQIVLWRRKTQFGQKCRNKVGRIQKFMRSKPQNVKKKSCSSKKFVLFSEKCSAQLECRSDGRAELFQTFSDTIFCLKTKKYVRTVTFFSRESNSHQMVACTRKLHFWQLRRNICVESVEILIQNLGSDEKNQNCSNRCSKKCSGDRNAVLSTVQKKGQQQSKWFPLWVQTDRNNPFF